jgi:signal transduction histidine kinase
MGVHLLLEGSTGELSPKQLEILTMCRDDALRLDTLVRELLDLSRLESGRGAPQLEVVRVADLLHGATEPLRRQAVVAGLTLSVRVPPELPDVLADPSQVERVLANLVTNAVRATAPGGRIDIAASPRESSVAFAVSDTGRGIPPDYLPRVFEPFVQVPDAPSGGSGLGLSISRRIVEAHRGQMTVRSEPGVGTTFTFTLPVAAGATSAGSGELCA